jgi:hypothetical protein
VAALLFVFDADPPLGEAELDFLREIATTVPRIVLVQTKCDTLPETDLREATAFNRAAIDSTYPALSNTPIFSVSALTGAGIAELRDALDAWDTDALRQERGAWQIKTAHAQAQKLMDMLQTERIQFDMMGMALKDARAAWIADLDTIRGGALATLARLSEYTLGNLSATIYQTDPVDLTGGRGLTLADNELRHVRDRLVSEIERALIESRRRLIEALTAASLPTDALPELPAIVLPDLQARTVTVQITGRRAFRPKQLDAEQTIKAYRTAVAHMSDTYAAELLPALELFLGDYRDALMGTLDKIKAELDAAVSNLTPL